LIELAHLVVDFALRLEAGEHVLGRLLEELG
jgi:hypothetical protein